MWRSKMIFPILAFAGLALAESAEAQCGTCFENGIAGLHRVPEQEAAPLTVSNTHFISSNGPCGTWHGHYACGLDSDDAELLLALRSGEPVASQELSSLLARNAGTVELSIEGGGLKVRSCVNSNILELVAVDKGTLQEMMVWEERRAHESRLRAGALPADSPNPSSSLSPQR